MKVFVVTEDRNDCVNQWTDIDSVPYENDIPVIASGLQRLRHIGMLNTGWISIIKLF
jgi:hypothetical protein